jgi:hypothetical protein
MLLEGEADCCIRFVRHLHQELGERRWLANEGPVGDE